MNATAVDSAVHALRAYCGLAGAHLAYTEIPAINWQQALMIFLFAFGSAILTYLDAHPVAGLLPSDNTQTQGGK